MYWCIEVWLKTEIQVPTVPTEPSISLIHLRGITSLISCKHGCGISVIIMFYWRLSKNLSILRKNKKKNYTHYYIFK